jgi:aspartyl-tRNA(Asn)/glutamyl-tRNA(Gln) amidotransferase subunit C
MTRITREELLKLARISYIHIDDQEIDKLVKEIDDVLSYATVLHSFAQGKKAEPLPQNNNIMREDFVIKTDTEPLLQQAPERQENYFVVPVILKQ